MVRRCSDKMAKLLLVVFNALFLVCGIALLLVACIDFKNAKSVHAIIEGLSSVNVFTVVVGAIIVIISFLGCCGALKENSCMLNTFLGLLIIILIAEVAVGYLAFSNRHEVEKALRDGAEKSLKDYVTHPALREAWDDVQLTWKCCGVEGYQDWKTKANTSIPRSCCKVYENQNEECTETSPNLQIDGCFPRMKDFAERNSLAIGVTAIIIAFVEVAGIIFACCLRSAINERYQTV